MSEITWGIVQSTDPPAVRFAGDDIDTPVALKDGEYTMAVGDKVLMAQAGTVGGWVAVRPIGPSDDPEFVYITTSPTAETGWSVSSFAAYVGRSTMSFTLIVERTGADITVGTSGNIGNEHVATLVEACRGTTGMNGQLGVTSTGRISGGYLNPNTGTVILSAVNGGNDITTGEEFELSGFVFLGNPA